ncbi:hypothetical protein AAVH_08967 [Aphelenchoides avenae]|nr:hypothetical protein AAVH_08967 [Aphelenchus avenae]
MGAIKHFPNENVEETRRVHFEYLEDKKKEFTNLLRRFKTEKDGLEADEAELVHRQWWAARQKETLTRDFENILEEERTAMHGQVKKNPQELEAEREGGEPNLQAQIELLDEAKRKVLVSLREVEDEEIGNLHEGEELRTKREELTRHTQETQQKLAGVEQALLRVSRAMKEQEATQSVRKEQLAAPPVEHDTSTRKRTAPQACEESQPTKAKTLHGLEEEEPEDEEEEEHVCLPVRENKAAVTNLQGPVRKSTNIALNTDGSSRAEEVSREKEVNASEPRAAEGPAMQQRSTSALISMDQLEEAIANMEFPRDDENKICVTCPYCKARKDVCGFPADIFKHFAAHLRSEDRPYLCSQDECHYTSVKVEKMRRHFEGRHKELTWTDEIAKACEVGPNGERLNAIKQVLAERTRLCAEKLSFEELEERANSSTLER